MFCSNCGKEVGKDDRFCGNCAQPLKEIINNVNYNKPLFWLSIVSVIVSFMAFNTIIMYIGIGTGLISLIGIILVLFENKKSKSHNNKNLYTLTFSLVGIISNLIWLLFTLHVLPVM